MQETSTSAHRPIPILGSISELSAAHEAWLVDIWGVMHNGVVPFEVASDACARFRLAGGVVLLLSNAPRPAAAVGAQLDRIGVPRFAYDAIVSSGDAARGFIDALGAVEVFHLGPERDFGIYEGSAARLGSAEAASAVVCTGLFDDEVETPEDYSELLSGFAVRRLPMICANPDIFVERGGNLVYCAGAIAEAYEKLGGIVQYAGKPHLPVYDIAFAKIDDIKKHKVGRDHILAIGDGLRTDIAGAECAGIPSVYIASSVHMQSGEALNEASLARLFPNRASRPIAAMAQLAW